ncbi:Glycosyl hydrolases family 2, sugar binding domain [Bremerella volcania]|uniref:Glycosyl hydrolases family 2, sugar binding domain n=1 Tax=Bremerella volcania TaxID=2527984 RepID=A0A518CA45_9BACT|nr:hypothetical protein [Bremerella volcania]QDU76099.1 Glycosyl hydrolases family 2, sugar binding domain [Bremerella volcania]
MRLYQSIAAGIAVVLSATPLVAGEAAELTQKINAISEEALGYPEAVKAVTKLSQMNADAIPEVLAAMKQDRPVAANWLRGAVEAIADKARQEGTPIANETLIEFIETKTHAPKSRSVAYHLLKQQDEEAAKKLVPGFENDASLELRLLAVDRLMEDAKAKVKDEQKEEAIAIYQQALTATRNAHQASLIADALKELEVEVDTTEHFGFLKNWHVIAAFEFAKGDGFDAVYPPEKEIDLEASYPGKLIDEIPAPAKWQPLQLGSGEKRVDFNKAFAPVKEVVGYAVTTFDSDEAQEVELRWGSPNATKVWVNGELVASDKVYHAGDNFDQYTAKAKLKPGENTILVKLVQNEQTQSWTNVWHFELRVCDHLGTAIADAKP